MIKSKLLTAVALAAMSLATASCGGGGGGSTPVVAPPPAPPPPPPPPTGTSFNVTPCLSQMVAGRSVQSILIPDILDLDLSQPAGFPNGRDLDDPVIDLVLAAIFLDLGRHPVDTLVNARVNPFTFDQPLRTTRLRLVHRPCRRQRAQASTSGLILPLTMCGLTGRAFPRFQRRLCWARASWSITIARQRWTRREPMCRSSWRGIRPLPMP
jgi:hypothetical protein